MVSQKEKKKMFFKYVFICVRSISLTLLAWRDAACWEHTLAGVWDFHAVAEHWTWWISPVRVFHQHVRRRQQMHAAPLRAHQHLDYRDARFPLPWQGKGKRRLEFLLYYSSKGTGLLMWNTEEHQYSRRCSHGSNFLCSGKPRMQPAYSILLPSPFSPNSLSVVIKAQTH